MGRTRPTIILLALVALAAGTAQTASAQRRQQIVTLGGGLSKYELGGVKNDGYVISVRFDGQFGQYVIFEPGVSIIKIESPFGSRHYLLPDVSLQLQGYIGRVRPFIGGGFGFANIATGQTENQWTLHAVTGLRIHLGGPWGVRLEGRARSIDPWYGHTLDLTVGLMRVLPSY